MIISGLLKNPTVFIFEYMKRKLEEVEEERVLRVNKRFLAC